MSKRTQTPDLRDTANVRRRRHITAALIPKHFGVLQCRMVVAISLNCCYQQSETVLSGRIVKLKVVKGPEGRSVRTMARN